MTWARGVNYTERDSDHRQSMFVCITDVADEFAMTTAGPPLLGISGRLRENDRRFWYFVVLTWRILEVVERNVGRQQVSITLQFNSSKGHDCTVAGVTI